MDHVESHGREPAMNDPGLPVESKRERIGVREAVSAKNVLAGFQMKPEVGIVERLRGKKKHEGKEVDLENLFEGNIFSHGSNG